MAGRKTGNSRAPRVRSALEQVMTRRIISIRRVEKALKGLTEEEQLEVLGLIRSSIVSLANGEDLDANEGFSEAP